MPMTQVLFILLAKSVVTLLPLVPAVILFEYLPASTATVSGPLVGFKGMQVKFEILVNDQQQFTDVAPVTVP